MAAPRPLRQPRGPGLPYGRRERGEQVHFHEPPELSRRELVLKAEGAEEREVEDLRRRDPDAGFLEEEFRVEVLGEVDLGEGAVSREAGEVAEVAEVVEGFARVFDGDFGDLRGGEGGGDEGVVEVGAVGVGLVGREDEELGDADAGGEGGGGEGVGGREGECVRGFLRGCGGRGGGEVGDKVVVCGVAD